MTRDVRITEITNSDSTGPFYEFMSFQHAYLCRLCLLLILFLIPLNCTMQGKSLKSEAEKKIARPAGTQPEVTEAPVAPSARDEHPSRQEPRSPQSKLHISFEQQMIVTSLLAQMSTEQRIAQRFMTWIPDTKLTRGVRAVIGRGNLGGVLLNSANIESREQIRQLTNAMQELAFKANPPIGLFIGVDQEGGRVNRFTLKEMTRFPAPFYLGEHNDADYIRSVAYITGTEIRAMGCNMNLAPVLDLYDNPDGSVIGDRSMGTDPEIVGRLGVHYVLGASSAGIISVIKHFPGQGITTIDSHGSLPVVPADNQTPIEEGIEPFRVAIENGAEAVMTAHVLYEKLDPRYPCTLSRRIIKDILRDELGFEGIVLSDAIEMGALRKNYDIREIIRLCIKAGIDLLLVNGIYNVKDLIETTTELLESGEITAREIDIGVERILRIKAKNGLLYGKNGLPFGKNGLPFGDSGPLYR